MGLLSSTRTRTTTSASSYCTPVTKYNNVYITKTIIPKCSDLAYQTIINSDYTNIEEHLDKFVNTTNNIKNWKNNSSWFRKKYNTVIDPDFLYSCIKNSQYDKSITRLNSDISEVDTQIKNYTEQKGLLDTYDEMNNSSLYYYKNDLIYVICKISFLIILIITYIYFFKLTGMIEPIKNLFNTIITKGNTIINKVTDKIKNPKPANAIPKPVNANSKPANANSKPVNANSKPANANPNANPKPVNAKRINANPKRINANPKRINANPKPANANPKPKI